MKMTLASSNWVDVSQQSHHKTSRIWNMHVQVCTNMREPWHAFEAEAHLWETGIESPWSWQNSIILQQVDSSCPFPSNRPSVHVLQKTNTCFVSWDKHCWYQVWSKGSPLCRFVQTICTHTIQVSKLRNGDAGDEINISATHTVELSSTCTSGDNSDLQQRVVFSSN